MAIWLVCCSPVNDLFCCSLAKSCLFLDKNLTYSVVPWQQPDLFCIFPVAIWLSLVTMIWIIPLPSCVTWMDIVPFYPGNNLTCSVLCIFLTCSAVSWEQLDLFCSSPPPPRPPAPPPFPLSPWPPPPPWKGYSPRWKQLLWCGCPHHYSTNIARFHISFPFFSCFTTAAAAETATSPAAGSCSSSCYRNSN